MALPTFRHKPKAPFCQGNEGTNQYKCLIWYLKQQALPVLEPVLQPCPSQEANSHLCPLLNTTFSCSWPGNLTRAPRKLHRPSDHLTYSEWHRAEPASDSTYAEQSQWACLARELGMQFCQIPVPNRPILLDEYKCKNDQYWQAEFSSILKGPYILIK